MIVVFSPPSAVNFGRVSAILYIPVQDPLIVTTCRVTMVWERLGKSWKTREAFPRLEKSMKTRISKRGVRKRLVQSNTDNTTSFGPEKIAVLTVNRVTNPIRRTVTNSIATNSISGSIPAVTNQPETG